jgi:hypothetical protein
MTNSRSEPGMVETGTLVLKEADPGCDLPNSATTGLRAVGKSGHRPLK